METNYIWKNGKIISWNEALDHNITHSLHYGSGVFEGIRFYKTKFGPKVFRLQEHIERLFYSASCIGMKILFSKKEIIDGILQLVKEIQIEEGYIRPIVYYGYGKMGLNPTGAKIEVVISAWAWGKYLSENPINVKIPLIRRIDPKTSFMKAKISGNYANSILASLEIKNQGYDEGLLLDTQGFIAEGPGENIFFVRGNEVFTPIEGTILPGITRDTIIRLFKDKFNIEIQKTRIDPKDLGEFRESFFVGTAAEVTPIGTITDEFGNKYIYSSGNKDSITSKIAHVYYKVVKGEDENYLDWLW